MLRGPTVGTAEGSHLPGLDKLIYFDIIVRPGVASVPANFVPEKSVIPDSPLAKPRRAMKYTPRPNFLVPLLPVFLLSFFFRNIGIERPLPFIPFRAPSLVRNINNNNRMAIARSTAPLLRRRSFPPAIAAGDKGRNGRENRPSVSRGGSETYRSLGVDVHPEKRVVLAEPEEPSRCISCQPREATVPCSSTLLRRIRINLYLHTPSIIMVIAWGGYRHPPCAFLALNRRGRVFQVFSIKRVLEDEAHGKVTREDLP